MGMMVWAHHGSKDMYQAVSQHAAMHDISEAFMLPSQLPATYACMYEMVMAWSLTQHSGTQGHFSHSPLHAQTMLQTLATYAAG